MAKAGQSAAGRPLLFELRFPLKSDELKLMPEAAKAKAEKAQSPLSEPKCVEIERLQRAHGLPKEELEYIGLVIIDFPIFHRTALARV